MDGERGLTLIEITIAMVVMGIGALGAVSWTLSSMDLEVVNRETSDATDAMRQLVEELQSYPHNELFVRFNDDPADDPDGPGTAIGHQFVISPDRTAGFLQAEPTAPPPAAARKRRVPISVELTFPVDALGKLSEAAADPAWGNQGWDLNADGALTPGDRGTDYQVLPIKIEMTWAGTRGFRSLVVTRFITRSD
jgi:prepilin-type N-terminal cleavage/methylation domain-containing protein